MWGSVSNRNALIPLRSTDSDKGSALVANTVQSVADAAAAAAIEPTAGRELYIYSADGGLFEAVTGGAPGMYASNGGGYCGTMIAWGAGTAAWRRKHDSAQFWVKWWGPLGNSSTGDDATFQRAIDYMHKLADDSGVMGELTWRGAIYTTSPKKVGKGIGLIGQGDGFVSQIIPLATYAAGAGQGVIDVNGADNIGGWAFRLKFQNFTINTTGRSKAQIPAVLRLKNAYNVKIEDVWCYESYGAAIDIDGCNDVVMIRPRVYGASAVSAHAEYGIRCRGESGGSQGGITIMSPDIEVCFKGISQEAGSKVTIMGGYAERNIIGWVAAGTTAGSLTVTGGLWESPGASGIAASIEGHNVTVTGGKYIATGGAGLTTGYATTKPENVHIRGAVGDIADSRNWASSRHTKDIASLHRADVQNVKTCADNVATGIYRVTIPVAANNRCMLDIDLYAQLVGYSVWTGKYRLAIAHPGSGNPTVTAVNEHAKTNINASGNYGLSIVVDAAVISATQVEIRVTANSSGALGEGMSVSVATDAQFWQSTDDGSVYIQAI